MTSDKKDDDVNDTSFIDKMISETTERELVAQLKKLKRDCVFEYSKISPIINQIKKKKRPSKNMNTC
jgi:hypothetical protein